jgi:AraC-like DNA-binding protein
VQAGYTIDLIALLALVGIAQGLFFGGVLITSGKSTANRFLGAAVGAVSLGLLGTVLVETRLILIAPHFNPATTFVDATYGPLFYFYVRALTQPSFRWQKKMALHFVPAALLQLLHVPLLFISPDILRGFFNEYYRNLEAGQLENDPVGTAIDVGLISFCLVYLVLSFRRLTAYEKAIRQTYSVVGRRSVTWLRLCLASLTLLWILWAVLSFTDTEQWIMTLPLTGTIVILAMGFMAFRRSEVFQETVEERPKYENSPLSAETAAAIREELTRAMTEKRLYEDPELTLQQLASDIGQSPRVISQVLNEHMNQSFFDFVNSCRIDRARQLLLENDEKILAVAYAVGFNSKSAFNAAFKRYTGTTPSSFRLGREREPIS